MHPIIRQIGAEVKKSRETEGNLKQGQFLETDIARKISQAGFQSVKLLGAESVWLRDAKQSRHAAHRAALCH
jgi:hypothetical protein